MKQIIIIIFSIFIISSCCKSSLIDTIKFTESDLSVNPYSGSEELKFIDDSNNIIIYNNGSRKINEQEVNECNGGCCDYYLVEMGDNTSFKSSYMESDLNVNILNNFNGHTGTQGIPTIYFSWNYYEITPYVTGTSFGGLPVDSMQQYAEVAGIYKDSLMLRNIRYYKIYTLPGNCPYPDRLHGDTLYYSSTQGIIGLKFSDGNLWVIQ